MDDLLINSLAFLCTHTRERERFPFSVMTQMAPSFGGNSLIINSILYYTSNTLSGAGMAQMELCADICKGGGEK